MKQLDRKPFLWKSEYEVSLHYTVERRDEIQKRIFMNKIHPANKRFVPYRERYNCSICKQHLLQCCHKIPENHGQFKTELSDQRNFLSPKIHHDFPQGLSIDGQSRVETACLKSIEGDQCQSISHDHISSAQQNPAHFDENIDNKTG